MNQEVKIRATYKSGKVIARIIDNMGNLRWLSLSHAEGRPLTIELSHNTTKEQISAARMAISPVGGKVIIRDFL